MSQPGLIGVGKLYKPGKTAWPFGVEYRYTSGGHELRLFWDRLTKKEIFEVARRRRHLDITR